MVSQDDEAVLANDVLAFYAPRPDHIVNDQLISLAVRQTLLDQAERHLEQWRHLVVESI